MKIKNASIAGGGSLGSQIAWQTAFKDFQVFVYDGFENGLETSKSLRAQFADLLLKPE
jgi:3-hydroxyacyl-CoA dehydrogenase